MDRTSVDWANISDVSNRELLVGLIAYSKGVRRVRFNPSLANEAEGLACACPDTLSDTSREKQTFFPAERPDTPGLYSLMDRERKSNRTDMDRLPPRSRFRRLRTRKGNIAAMS